MKDPLPSESSKNKPEHVKIDKKDISILQELDKDIRASYTKIGRNTKLSKEVVQYRLRNLEKKGIITGYWTISQVGDESHAYKLLIKNKSLGIKKKKEFIAYVLSKKAVSWFATTEGNWDFIITSYIKNNVLFSEFVIDLMKKYGKYFKEKHILKSTSLTVLNEKYLYPDGKTIKVESCNFLKTQNVLDAKDEEIMKLLSENARLSFSEIGRKVNLTSEAVSVRFRKLKKQRSIVTMNPRINHEKLGLEYYHIFISVSDYEKKDDICNYYSQHPACVFIIKHVGYYDIHLEIVVKQGEIESIIDDLSERFGDYIAAYEPLRITKEHIMIMTR
jgi:Lrp/AsnC family transcriptional regulator, leucine-responsive regulatory protein